MQKILILFVHPAYHKSRVNKELLKQIDNLEGVTIQNLYESYPNFHINVKREQQLLLDHDIIVWHHPFYWYSAPSLLKEWIDLVLEHNWAYGRNGNALKGKKLLTTLTAGGGEQAYSEDGYNKHTIQQFLAPYRQTARLCKMAYLPPFVVHGTHLLAEIDIAAYALNYKSLLVSLRDDLFSDDEISKTTYLNELIR